ATGIEVAVAVRVDDDGELAVYGRHRIRLLRRVAGQVLQDRLVRGFPGAIGDGEEAEMRPGWHRAEGYGRRLGEAEEVLDQGRAELPVLDSSGVEPDEFDRAGNDLAGIVELVDADHVAVAGAFALEGHLDLGRYRQGDIGRVDAGDLAGAELAERAAAIGTLQQEVADGRAAGRLIGGRGGDDVVRDRAVGDRDHRRLVHVRYRDGEGLLRRVAFAVGGRDGQVDGWLGFVVERDAVLQLQDSVHDLEAQIGDLERDMLGIAFEQRPERLAWRILRQLPLVMTAPSDRDGRRIAGCCRLVLVHQFGFTDDIGAILQRGAAERTCGLSRGESGF